VADYLPENETEVLVETADPSEAWPAPAAVATGQAPEPAARSAKPPAEESPRVPEDDILFSKQYYTMRETAAMFGISHSMLRFWEAEFDSVKPKKNKKGDRYFRPADIKQLALIYHLLKVRKFTTSGARDYLRNHNKALDSFELVQKLEKLKAFLQELKTSL
jgi:DNA-binding transcriptional MerR regulator